MNLVKWFRRNNRKVMAIVVIVIMIGFIGGSALTGLLQSNRGRNTVIAYVGDKTEVTDEDLKLARRELEILKMLNTEVYLRSRNLHGIVLGELLFSDVRDSAMFVNSLKQTIRQNGFSVSEKEINDIYRRQWPPDLYWHCLQHEVGLAGVVVRQTDVSELLARTIPQLFQGRTYSEVVGAIMSRQRISQEQVLATFGKLVAVLEYAEMVCSTQDVTTRQAANAAVFEEERINAEYVRIDSGAFIETMDEPNEAMMTEHFEKYKRFLSGTLSDDNPYGFGYKLPDRIRLEYLAVKADDVRTIVKEPTQDELGDEYNRNKQSFTEQVQSDPNDPNSMTERVKNFAEVADTIFDQLLKKRISARTESILQEARTLTEAGFADMNDVEIADLDTERFAKLAGDYEKAAKELSAKYDGIKVYTGRTGWLDPMAMQTDEQLRTLIVRGYAGNPVRLGQVVFAVDELAASELGQFDVRAPRMHENIGPVRDWMSEYDISGTIMAIVRVIDAQKACEPESINQTFGTASFIFDPNQEETDEDIYSVKEKVAEDVKKLTAMGTAKTRAEELIAQAAKDGWKDAVDNLNELHRQQQGQDANEPDAFRLQNSRDLRRTPRAALETLAIQNEGNPVRPFLLNESYNNRMFVDQLYSLVPADSDTAKGLPLVLEVEPDMSYYAVKNISVKRLWKEGYEKIKVKWLAREDYIRSQSLATIHFNPENILKRLKFRWARIEEESENAEAPAESEAVS